MPNTIVRRLMVGASTFCFLRVCAIAPQAQAQNIAIDLAASNSNASIENTEPNAALNVGLSQSSALLLSAETQSHNLAAQRVRLSQVANNLNMQMAEERAIAARPVGFQLSTLLDSLPIVSDLVDDNGNMDMAKGLPFSVGLGDVMGQTGVVLSTDF